MVKRRKTCSLDDAAVGIEPDAGFGSVSLTARGSDGVMLSGGRQWAAKHAVPTWPTHSRSLYTHASKAQSPALPSALHCSMGS